MLFYGAFEDYEILWGLVCVVSADSHAQQHPIVKKTGYTYDQLVSQAAI